MRIGIDCRMAGTGEGIGRYIEELTKNLALVDGENEYFLLFQDRAASAKRKAQSAKFKNIMIRSKYYSWSEQTWFVRELKMLKLDLVHFPNFNVPILYPGKFVMTIHDIIHHQFPGNKKSRLFHRLAYRATIGSAVRRASKIIAVSEATKNDILKTFSVPPERVEVIYEGVEQAFFERVTAASVTNTLAKFDVTKPYILFVGVWRQYKNLPKLALAFDILRERHALDIQLVLAGKMDAFYPEIKEKVMSIKNSNEVRALGYVQDSDLRALYQQAKAFVLPSLIEGFGLIGAEAQASGVAVAASDIPVLREILGKGAVYFDPGNEKGIADKIFEILSADTSNLRNLALENARRFDWPNCAKETLKIYKDALDAK